MSARDLPEPPAPQPQPGDGSRPQPGDGSRPRPDGESLPPAAGTSGPAPEDGTRREAAGPRGRAARAVHWRRPDRRRRRRGKGPLRWFRIGVAGQILRAITVMFLGIVLLTTTILYIQLSQKNNEHFQDLLSSSADSLAGSPAVHEALFADSAFYSTDVQAPGAGPGWVEGTQGRADFTDYLTGVKADYELDRLAVFSAEALRGAEIGSGASDPAETIRATGGPATEEAAAEVLAAIDPDPVLAGRTVLQFVDGESGGTLYAVAPVYSTPPGEEPAADAEVAAVVATGLHADTIRADFAPQGRWIIGSGALTILMGTIAVWLASRGLKRVTGDYGTQELGEMLDFYSSVLQAVSEGLLLIDRNHGIVIHNTEAAELLGLPAEAAGDPVRIADLELPESLRALLASGRWARDEIHYTDDHVLVVNQQPTEQSPDTWVTTMRDHTELQELSGELVSVRSFSESLRSQTHEYANRLHTMVSLIEIGHSDQALEFATREIDQMDRPADNLLGGFDHPVLSALLLTKLSQAKEAGIELEVDTSGLTGPLSADDRDLVTVIGNLLDNAFDAVSRAGTEPARRRVYLTISGAEERGYTVEVADDGPGIPEDSVDQVFERGFSTKHDGVEQDSGAGRTEDGSRGVGLSLVVQAVRRLGGAIDVRGGPDCEGDPLGAAFEVWLPGTPPVRQSGVPTGSLPIVAMPQASPEPTRTAPAPTARAGSPGPGGGGDVPGGTH